MNMSPENKAHFLAEKEAIHLILTGIGDEIYSTVDACQTAQEIWEAIERTSSNSKNKNVDTTPRYKNDDHSGQSGTHRTVNVTAARENVGSKVVQQSGIQCFNCREFRHFAKECRKPKRVKDSAYHKEKMMLCKQAEQGVPLQAEHYDWLRHRFRASRTASNTCLVETDDSNVIPDSPDMCEDNIQNEQNDVESDDERQLAHKDTVIREGLKTKAYKISVVKEKHDELMKQSLLTKSHYEGLVKQKTKGKAKSVDTKFDRPSVVLQPNAQWIPKPSVLGKPTPFSNSLDIIYFQKTRSVSKANVSEGLSKPVTAQTLPQAAKKAVSNTNVLTPGLYRIDNRIAHKRAPRLPQIVRNTNPRVSTSTGVNHKHTVSGPQLKSNQSRDKVKENQEKDKIRSKPDKNRKRGEAGKSQKQLQWIKQEKLKKTQKEGPKVQSHSSFIRRKKRTRANVLSHLNFDYINLLSKKDIVIGLPKLKYVKDQLCSSFELSKVKKSSFKSKAVSSSKGRLNLLHMDLCGLMRVASINGKKYIMVIVDDYSRYTWTLFLRSKDETPEVLKDFLTLIQRNLQA
nr:retrovirus-related Pol polyprotein from transposon TNT 1-94 [Tanacetum cinerariifolium]